jgi:hypothetical protein
MTYLLIAAAALAVFWFLRQRLVFAKALLIYRKWRDRQRTLTDKQGEILLGYYSKAMSLFETMGINIESKPEEQRRLYHMMLLYLDHEEVVCPWEARTASLIGFLDSLGTGWQLPAASDHVSKKFAKEVDGWMAVEIFRNHLGLKDIHDEIQEAIARAASEIHQRTTATPSG